MKNIKRGLLVAIYLTIFTVVGFAQDLSIDRSADMDSYVGKWVLTETYQVEEGIPESATFDIHLETFEAYSFATYENFEVTQPEGVISVGDSKYECKVDAQSFGTDLGGTGLAKISPIDRPSFKLPRFNQVAINNSGQLVLVYASSKIATTDSPKIRYAYIFSLAE